MFNFTWLGLIGFLIMPVMVNCALLRNNSIIMKELEECLPDIWEHYDVNRELGGGFTMTPKEQRDTDFEGIDKPLWDCFMQIMVGTQFVGIVPNLPDGGSDGDSEPSTVDLNDVGGYSYRVSSELEVGGSTLSLFSPDKGHRDGLVPGINDEKQFYLRLWSFHSKLGIQI